MSDNSLYCVVRRNSYETSQKEGQYLNVRINRDVYERLGEICEEAGHTKTYVVEKALTGYFADYDDNQSVLQRIKDGSAKLVDTGK